MHLRDYLDPSLIFTGLTTPDKRTLLEDLARRAAAQITGVDRKALEQRMVARERDSSTGVGEGVAIPHCFLEGLEKTACVLAQVPDGVDYDAIDEKPVFILFMLMSPPDARMAHLRLLARISRVASREGFAKEAAAATTPDELHKLIVREDRSHTG